MALLLVCVLLLPTAYALFRAFTLYNEHRSSLVATLERTADLISTHQSEFFYRTRLLLQTLAAQPQIVAAAMPACMELLQTELQKTHDYGNFNVADEHGIVRCSSASDLIGMNLSDRSYFQRLRDGSAFDISEVLYRRGGQGRTVIAGLRLPNKPDGGFAGTVEVSINLAVLDARIRILSLPEDALVFLTDERGEVLAATDEEDEASPRERPSKQQIVQLISRASGAEVHARVAGDVVARRFITASIRGTPLYVVLGLPILDEWAWLERDLLLALFAPSAMLALALIAIWVATDFLVNRHVAALARTARSYGGGRFDVPLQLSSAPIELRDLGAAMVKMARRVGEREEELKQSLEQKNMLLREIHHRVKNNLQIVTSLLNLRIRSIPSPAAQLAMLEAQTRIKALALVHRNLYEHQDFDAVDLRSLVGELCELLQDSAERSPGPVTMKIDVAPVQVTTDKAIPIALLITECVTNCLKHAFQSGTAGTIEVRLAEEGGTCRLLIADDGIGIGAAHQAQAERGCAAAGESGVGLRLIDMLAKQIGGKIRIEGPPGTRFSVSFVK